VSAFARCREGRCLLFGDALDNRENAKLRGPQLTNGRSIWAAIDGVGAEIEGEP